MAARRYSERLGVITDEQFQAALDRFGLGRLLRAEPIENGLFGQNVMLSATSGDYVFRGAPHWNPAGEDDWQFQKERFFSRLAHDADGGPPVAWPYLLEESRDIFGWGFALQPRLPGEAVRQPPPEHYNDDEQREMARELGTALGQLHTVKAASAGTYVPRGDRLAPLAGSYADYVESTIEALLAYAREASNATSEDDMAWARSVMAGARPAMELDFEPCVVHLDYGLHNVLFQHRDGEWRLTGIIDWMTAEAGHPECDLARPLATFRQFKIAGVENFMAAYRERQPQLPGFRDRLPVFMLWERLLIWGYWQHHKGFREGLGMRAWMEPYVRVEV